MSKFIVITLFITGVVTVNSFAQFSVFNISEYQLGNIPGRDPNDLQTFYDQFNAKYRYKNFSASVRIEHSSKTINHDANYTRLSQFLLNYKKRGLDLNAGHFYTTLGNGLLLRGYEIKNSIFEDQIYRVRQGFYKDIRGGMAAYNHKFFSVKLLSGDLLNNQLPPFADDKRIDNVTGGEVGANIKNQHVGLIYLENKNPNLNTKYTSILLDGTITDNFSYFGEFAKRIDPGKFGFSLNDEDSYGIYLGTNFTTTGFGISLEYKDYHNFLIGNGLADPPTLVKEHSYKLLNRSTHFTELNDESGVQAELFANLAEGKLLTVNYSRAVNNLYQKFVFQEFFAEYAIELKQSANAKFYIDYSSEDLKKETGRYAAGFNFSKPIQNSSWAYNIESEFQHVERDLDFQTSYHNIYSGLTLNKSTKFSVSIIWEFTNDKVIADRANTEKIETKKHFPGLNLQFKPNRVHTFRLFVGERRGGPACTSGICYEVLDFKGVELNYSIRL